MAEVVFYLIVLPERDALRAKSAAQSVKELADRRFRSDPSELLNLLLQVPSVVLILDLLDLLQPMETA